jgi:hypothetical protein
MLAGSLRALASIAVGLVACSAPADPVAVAADGDARRLLPTSVGLLIAEGSLERDSAALESIAPGTHVRTTTTGFGIDPDQEFRRVRDPRDGRDRFFTLHRTQGLVVERDREGTSIARHEVFDARPADGNPYDVAIASDGALFVARYYARDLLILDPSGGRRTVDLRPFADEDGIPEQATVTISGDRAYVGLKRLTRNDPIAVSKIVVVDTKTLAAELFVDLPFPNPWEGSARIESDALWLACIGGPISRPTVESAGIVRIDLATRAVTVVADQAALGGFPVAFVREPRGTLIVSVAAWSPENATTLVRFDPRAGRIVATLRKTDAYRILDVDLLDDERILLADRTPEDPGIHVLSPEGAPLGRIPTRLPPTSFFVVEGGAPLR